MIFLSKVPAFGYETKGLPTLYTTNAVSRAKHNAEKIIGYLPGLSIIQGVHHLRQSCNTRKFSAFFILRGLLEIACLGFLLAIPDLIITALRQQKLAKATLKDKVFRPIPIKSEPFTLALPTPTPPPKPIDWAKIKERCLLQDKKSSLTKEWLQCCLKVHGVDSTDKAIHAQLKELAMTLAAETQNLTLVSYLLHQKVVTRSAPEDIDYLKELGLKLIGYSTGRSPGTTYLSLLELNPKKPGCLNAIRAIACQNAKKFGYIHCPPRLQANVPEQKAVLLEILKESVQIEPWHTLENSYNYNLDDSHAQLIEWAIHKGTLEDRYEQALEQAKKFKTDVVKDMPFYHFETKNPLECEIVKKIAVTALTANFEFTSHHFKHFELDDAAVEEVLVAAAQKTSKVIENFADLSTLFGISLTKKLLTKIAIGAAKLDPVSFTTKFLPKLAFKPASDPQILLEIAKTASALDAAIVAKHLSKYFVTDSEEHKEWVHYVHTFYSGTLEERHQKALEAIERDAEAFARNFNSYFLLDKPEEHEIIKELAVLVIKKGSVFAMSELNLQKLPEGKEIVKQVLLQAILGPTGVSPLNSLSLWKEWFDISPQNPDDQAFYRQILLEVAPKEINFCSHLNYFPVDLNDPEVLGALKKSALLMAKSDCDSIKKRLAGLPFDKNNPEHAAFLQEVEDAVKDWNLVDKELKKLQPSFNDTVAKLRAAGKKFLLDKERANYILGGYKGKITDEQRAELIKLLQELEENGGDDGIALFFCLLKYEQFSPEEKAAMAKLISKHSSPEGVMKALDFNLDDAKEQALFIEVLHSFAADYSANFPWILQKLKAPFHVTKACLAEAVKHSPAIILEDYFVKHLGCYLELNDLAYKSGTLEERKQQAILEAKRNPKHFPDNLIYYVFPQSIIHELAEHAIINDLANIDSMHLFGLDPSALEYRKIVQAALLKAYQKPSTTLHIIKLPEIAQKWFNVNDPNEFQCLAEIVKHTAAKNLQFTNLHTKKLGLDFHNPMHKKVIVDALEMSYQCNPVRTLEKLPKFGCSGGDLKQFAMALQTKYPSASGPFEERQKAALNCFKFDIENGLSNLEFFFKLPEEKHLLDDFAVEVLGITHDPTTLLVLYSLETNLEKIKEILKKKCAKNATGFLNLLAPFIKNHKELDNFAFIREVLLTAVKNFPVEVLSHLKKFGLDPEKEADCQLLKEIGVIAGQKNGKAVKDHIMDFGFDKYDKKQKHALAAVMYEAIKEDGGRNIYYEVVAENYTYKGQKYNLAAGL